MGGFVAAVPRGAPATAELIERVVAASRDRAPDGVRHVVTSDGVLLVQCMFANTPESVGEQLPLCDPSGRVWIVKRGHLNNIEELRGRLRDRLGPGARVHTDAEVMLSAYLAWGGNMAGRIHGEFALAIWDGRNGSLFVLRDHLGLRGCYTHDGPDWYVAASEPAQVLPFPGVSDELDEVALVDYMSGWMIDRTRTFYAGIGRPMPATAVTVRGRDVIHQSYWTPSLCRDKASGPPDDAARAILEVFEQAMRSVMRSPTAVVCDLSGGLDSSAVLGMAAKLRRDEPETIPEVIAHSMLYPGLDCDETPYIEAVLEKWPVPWHGFDYLHATAGRDDRDALMRSLKFMVGGRTTGVRARGLWMRDNAVRVELAGDFGDELFFSGPLPLNWGVRPRGERWPYLWWASRRSASALATRVRRELIRPHVPRIAMNAYLAARGRRIHASEYFTPRASALLNELRTTAGSFDRRTSVLTDGLWNPGNLFAEGVSDAISLRHGYEVRRPFADHRLVDLVTHQPLLFHRWQGRWRAQQKLAFGALYPALVSARNYKADFTEAFSEGVDGPAQPAAELLERGLVDRSAHERSVRDASNPGPGTPRVVPWNLWATQEISRWRQVLQSVGRADRGNCS